MRSKYVLNKNNKNTNLDPRTQTQKLKKKNHTNILINKKRKKNTEVKKRKKLKKKKNGSRTHKMNVPEHKKFKHNPENYNNQIHISREKKKTLISHFLFLSFSLTTKHNRNIKGPPIPSASKSKTQFHSIKFL